MAGIGVIVNRNAARADRCARSGYILGDNQTCQETGSPSELARIVGKFQKRKIDILCIGGGDGSNQQVLTALIKGYGDRPLPRVVFLRAGTHNACARSIGQRGDPQEILSRLVRKYHLAEPIEVTSRSMLRIRHGLVDHYGFTLSTGFMYRYFRRVHLRNSRSPLGSAGVMASMVGGALVGSRGITEMFRLVPARLTLGGVVMPWNAYNGAAASTMEQVGLGLRPFSRANESFGRFQAMAFRMNPGRLLRVAWALGRGRLRSGPEHLSAVTDSLEIESTEPIPYALDGDIFPGSLSLRITPGPQLKLLVV